MWGICCDSVILLKELSISTVFPKVLIYDGYYGGYRTTTSEEFHVVISSPEFSRLDKLMSH